MKYLSSSIISCHDSCQVIEEQEVQMYILDHLIITDHGKWLMDHKYCVHQYCIPSVLQGGWQSKALNKSTRR